MRNFHHGGTEGTEPEDQERGSGSGPFHLRLRALRASVVNPSDPLVAHVAATGLEARGANRAFDVGGG